MVVLIVAADRQVTIAGVCSLSGVICLSCLVSGSVNCSSMTSLLLVCVLFQVSFVCHVWLVVVFIVAADRQATIAGVCSLSGVICLSCLVSGSVNCSSR